MKKIFGLPLILSLALALGAAGSLPAQPYLYYALGTLGGGTSYAFGINASGQVVGESQTTGGQTRAFLWTAGGGMQNLGTLGGSFSRAYDINDQGQIVGAATGSSGPVRAFLYELGEMKPLGDSGVESFAFGINSSGQVAGRTGEDINMKAALLPPAGGYTLLGANPPSEAAAINAAGLVVGTLTNESGFCRAFWWTPASGVNDLGSWGDEYSSFAYAVNAYGQVVGEAETADGIRAFRAAAGTPGLQDLGALGGSDSYALGINNLGQVVGISLTSSGDYHAFLYSGAAMLDLNDLVQGLPEGVYLQSARDINDQGAIVGYDSDNRAFLLLVPLPSTLFLMITGLMALVALGRRRQKK
ncbi:MAG: DUF3466 family protein [Deltaproteobacteria bacterium]|nr:DUF3466 family protein [Deltaproteobacteria bacterium]